MNKKSRFSNGVKSNVSMAFPAIVKINNYLSLAISKSSLSCTNGNNCTTWTDAKEVSGKIVPYYGNKYGDFICG